MTKRDIKRAEILKFASNFLLDNGLYGFSLRPLAHSLGTSDRMLLHYFSTKEELLYEVLDYLLTETIKMLNNDSLSKIDLAAFIKNLSLLTTHSKYKKYLKLWIELSSYNGHHITLPQDFIDKLFFNLFQGLDSIIIIPKNFNKMHFLSLMLVIIEGSMIISAYNKPDIIDNAMILLENLTIAST